jgi:hypothetical protein
MVNCSNLAIHHVALHGMLFPLAEYAICSRFFTLLYLPHSDCCSDWESFEDYPGEFQEF